MVKVHAQLRDLAALCQNHPAACTNQRRHTALALLGGMLLLQSTASRQMCQVLSKLQLAAVAASMLMEGLAVLGSCHSICAWPPHS